MNINDLFEPFEEELQLQEKPRIAAPPLIEWRVAFGDFFFRPKGADPQLLWCDLGYTVTPKRPLPPTRKTTLTKRVSRTFAGRTFFRVVPFADGDDWALVRPKRALVKSPHRATGAWWEWNANFGTLGKTQFQWLSQDLEWFEQWLGEQQKKEQGLKHARAFASLSDDERSWAPMVAPPDLLQQWQQLTRALQQLTAVEGGTPLLWRISGRQNAQKVMCLYLDMDSPLRSNLPASKLAAARKLRSELTARFTIPIEFSRWRGLEPNGDQQFYHYPQLPIDTESMHEKMEAALLWRDFIAKSDRQEELEAALGELIR